MKRVTLPARPDFEKRNNEIGFDFGDTISAKYCNETAGYQLNASEIDRLEAATNELFKMTMDLAADLVQDSAYMENIGLPPEYQAWVKRSWDDYNFSLYGRFDFFFDGNQIKLYEYNADTPTSLLESSLVQYYWMQDRKLPDQFNSIHEKLIAAWKFIQEKELSGKKLYLSSLNGNHEDYRTVEYLMDTASQAGCQVQYLKLDDVGSDGQNFYDLQEQKIEAMFKLYPWEWLLIEQFATTLPKAETLWVEPPWKILLSNKALLVKLWEKYPGHELLLPTFFKEPGSGEFVRKPIYSREGMNIMLPDGKETEGDYNNSGYVYQQYRPLPNFDGWYPMVGSWVVGDEAAGIGIREDKSLVTGNFSQFVSHWFE